MSGKLSGMVLDLDLQPTKKLVLVTLADHADDKGDRIYPGVKRVAKVAGVTPRTVRRVISEFVKLGVLEVVGKPYPGRATRYRMHIICAQDIYGVLVFDTEDADESSVTGDKMSSVNAPTGDISVRRTGDKMSSVNDQRGTPVSAVNGQRGTPVSAVNGQRGTPVSAVNGQRGTLESATGDSGVRNGDIIVSP